MSTKEHDDDLQPTTDPSERCGYLPLVLKAANLPCLVVGGGRIGTRKALTLLKAGAKVTVLSPEMSDELQRELARNDRLAWCNDRYDSAALDGFTIMVAATANPELNLRIGRDAEARGILHCIVSSGENSRVIFPAVGTAGGITVAVHTGGRNCVKSRDTRNEIVEWLKSRQDSEPQ